MENYFNYYTEIEEYFWQKRGASLLVSTLDWAVIESWQKAGVPLEVVLKGIDRAFEHYDSAKRGRPIKSLLYCVDAVAQVAEEAKEAAAGRASDAPAAPRPAPFGPGEIAAFFRANASALRETAGRSDAGSLAAPLLEIADALEALAGQPATETTANLEGLERQLSVFEEKLQAALTQAASTEELLALRREVERALAPYRRRMKAEQLVLIEKQFLQKKLLERYRLPRLSLFYLPAAALPTAEEGS
ncbi:MAG: hypothetical protein HYY26_07425 [Acidobacteria bacterium]|nr:hypothetical protein [Acidobacteriota bacterium]